MRRPSMVILAAAVILLLWTTFISAPLFVQLPARLPVRHHVAMVLLSGDAGFGVGMGRQVAERFAAAGMPVTGINSLVYFSKWRSPEATARLVRQAMARALRTSPNAQVILVGQSFGADMLIVGLDRLPADLRKRVALVALIVPTRTVYYRISPVEYFEIGPPDASALPRARRLDWVPVICIRGAAERDSLCPLLDQPNVRRIVLPGGHPLHRDADRLFATLRAAIARTMTNWS